MLHPQQRKLNTFTACLRRFGAICVALAQYLRNHFQHMRGPYLAALAAEGHVERERQREDFA